MPRVSVWLSKTWDAIMRETANNERTDRLEIHNSCVDERLAALQLWAGTVGFLADNRRVCRVQCNRTRRR